MAKPTRITPAADAADPAHASPEAAAAGMPAGAIPATPMAPVTNAAPLAQEGVGLPADPVGDMLDAAGVVGRIEGSADLDEVRDVFDNRRVPFDLALPLGPQLARAFDAADRRLLDAETRGIDPLVRPEPMPVGPQPPASHHHHATPVLDRLLHHPDGVVRARAAEAIASRNRAGADAGILARAAIDTARELDRSAGRIARDREF